LLEHSFWPVLEIGLTSLVRQSLELVLGRLPVYLERHSRECSIDSALTPVPEFVTESVLGPVLEHAM